MSPTASVLRSSEARKVGRLLRNRLLVACLLTFAGPNERWIDGWMDRPNELRLRRLKYEVNEVRRTRRFFLLLLLLLVPCSIQVEVVSSGAH